MAIEPLWSAIRRLHARLATDAFERFPARAPWEPATTRPGNRAGPIQQGVAMAVPRVPTVPCVQGDTSSSDAPDCGPGDADWEERAAILEYEAGLARATAEALAGGAVTP